MKQFSATDIKVDNLSIDGHIDKLKLTAIEQTKSDTAVDVFVYDTSLDSDGGAWRKRTSHTSWYNETLNTSTRGSRREFPAVVVIVVEDATVTIYDADDGDLNMWMVFTTWGFGNNGKTSCAALNGMIVVGSHQWGTPQANFIKDTIDHQWNSAAKTLMSGGIVNRNVDSRTSAIYDQLIVDNNVNDVAMTVLPGAPIDTDTGLPIPTTAVATDGGVSVIKDDGSVVNITNHQSDPAYLRTNHITFTKDGRIRYTMDSQGRYYRTHNIPGEDFKIHHWSPELDDGITLYTESAYGDAAFINGDDPITAIEAESLGNGSGLTLFDEYKQEPEKSIVAYVNSKYNTGWMPGDVKLATLSDTTVEEDIGIDESTEKVVNGTFSGTIENGDFTAWSIPDGYSVTDNDLYYTGTGVQYAKPRQRLTGLIIGQQYKVSFVVTSISHHNIWVVTHWEGAVTGHHGGLLVNKPGHYEYNFVAATENDWIVVQNNIDSQTFRIDNISIKPSGELITNGTFDNNTDIDGWVSANNATLSNTDDNLRIDKTDTTYFAARQEFPTVTGKRYKVCYELIESDSVDGVNGAYFQISGINVPGSTHQAYNTDVSDLYPTTTGKFSYEFVALSDTSEVRAAVGSSGTYAVWDNISVRLAEPDRSVNNNGLQVFGEITKSPVAPGADLVAYSGFSADNYLIQPYNSDLDFGTGDFSFTYWINSPSIDYDQSILCQGDYTASTNNRGIYSLVYNSGGSSGDDILVGVGTEYVSVGTHENLGWIQIYAVRQSGILSVYKNGVLQGQISSVTDINYSNIENNNLVIGAMYTTPKDKISYAYDGSIALLRISATASTAEQIAKIYRDEKVLFQDGAQATLDGASDAVTALAHDSVTDLLHVGTSSGTSVFSGLQRVTSDSEPVTTCIDAQDELVVKR